ncbi:replicase [Circovirus sp.]|nr:replicase [Circovirus sp.]
MLTNRVSLTLNMPRPTLGRRKNPRRRRRYVPARRNGRRATRRTRLYRFKAILLLSGGCHAAHACARKSGERYEVRATKSRVILYRDFLVARPQKYTLPWKVEFAHAWGCAAQCERQPANAALRAAASDSHAAMNRTVRKFVFTWNNYTEDDIVKVKEFLTNNCKYGIFGKEIAPTTGTPHLQGYANLIKPMRFSTIKKRLHNGIHIEKAAGSDIDNQRYCSKAGEIFETGNPQSQGKRNDLQSVVDTIQSGTTDIKSLASKHPTTFIKYFRGIKEYLRSVVPIQPRFFKTEVYYYVGLPGTGKSRTALEEARAHAEDSIYYKPRGLWWDGYQQQKCVIIDDFYGWIKYDEMLKIMDRYPYQVQVKGGFEEFTTEKLWITTNVDTDFLYKFEGYNTAAFDRRITCKRYFE